GVLGAVRVLLAADLHAEPLVLSDVRRAQPRPEPVALAPARRAVLADADAVTLVRGHHAHVHVRRGARGRRAVATVARGGGAAAGGGGAAGRAAGDGEEGERGEGEERGRFHGVTGWLSQTWKPLSGK